MGILIPQGIECDLVIKNRLDDCVLWDKLIDEHYFAHRVIETAYAELAHLNTITVIIAFKFNESYLLRR